MRKFITTSIMFGFLGLAFSGLKDLDKAAAFAVEAPVFTAVKIVKAPFSGVKKAAKKEFGKKACK